MTWNRVILSDGAVPASATAVVYNASQGAGGTFYAFIRRHGLYSSTDGQHFTRLTTQPGAGLASGFCPASSNASSCLIYRGEFAVVPGRNEMYVWVVDVQPDNNGNPAPVDEGIWRSTNGGTSWTAIPDNGITNCGDSAFGPNSGCGVEQGYYNLELAAIPDRRHGNGSLRGRDQSLQVHVCVRGHDLHARRLDQSDARVWLQPGPAGGAGARASGSTRIGVHGCEWQSGGLLRA